ncbi:MAG TPA: YIP1 family protein [Thermoanaerobaculia bacterium]|nr:YIP1 family protein [Thermoanaerobaculia bacterium]
MGDSSFGRLIGVLVSPGKTFRSIAERPAWLAPFLVLLVLSLAVGWLVQTRVDPEEMVRYQFGKFIDRVPPEQVTEAIEKAENVTPGQRALQIGIGAPVAALVYAAIAAVFLGIFKLLGSEMTFKQSFSTYLYGSMPMAVAALINLPLILAREKIAPEEAMGGGVLVASPEILVSEETSAVIRSLLGSLNFFTLWTLALLILGYRIVARVSLAASTGTVITLWLLWVAGKAGFAALFR